MLNEKNAVAKTIYGSDKADTILDKGGVARTVLAKAGDDLVKEGGGNDILRGGSGDDTLWGNAGADLLNGG